MESGAKYFFDKLITLQKQETKLYSLALEICSKLKGDDYDIYMDKIRDYITQQEANNDVEEEQQEFSNDREEAMSQVESENCEAL